MDPQTPDPIKPKGKKGTLVTLIVVLGILVIGSGVLGYLYYKSRGEKDNLANQNKSLLEQLSSASVSPSPTATSTELQSLKNRVSALEKEKSNLKGQVNSYKSKIKKAQAYNEFYKFLNSVIETHGGYTGWTDAEFETGKQKAEATGDASFVSTINWAWYETSIPPYDRVLRVQKEIVDGIENALK